MKIDEDDYSWYRFHFKSDYRRIYAFSTEDLGDRAGIQECNPCDDPTIYQTLLIMSDNYPARGMVAFYAESFYTSISKKGVLQVTWTAYADVELTFQHNEYYTEASPTWTVTGYFTPDPKHPGMYRFWKAKFASN